MDIVYIQGLGVETVIGVHAWERSIRQTLVIDLEMQSDIATAAATDTIDQALNYDAVAGRVAGLVRASRFQLIESVAEAVAGLLLDEFRVPWVRVRVAKPGAVPGTQNVGVVIERRREPV